MKNRNRKIQIIGTGILLGIVFLLISNINAAPSADSLGCHPTDAYSITVDQTELQAGISETVTLTITATGPGVVVDIYTGAMDNDEFEASSTIIEDNSENDLDAAVDSIQVEIEVTVPAVEGVYTLRILARESELKGVGTALNNVDVEITVGVIILTPAEIFFDHLNLYLGGLAMIFILIGTLLYEINLGKRGISRVHGIFFLIGFLLTNINIFLILNDAANFAFNEMNFSNAQDLGQFNHIIMGIIGYIASIIVLIGTYTDVKRPKLKMAVYLNIFTWGFNFVHGIIMLTTNFGLGG